MRLKRGAERRQKKEKRDNNKWVGGIRDRCRGIVETRFKGRCRCGEVTDEERKYRPSTLTKKVAIVEEWLLKTGGR